MVTQVWFLDPQATLRQCGRSRWTLDDGRCRTYHTVGQSTWFSNALVGLQRRHPLHVPQMEPEDKHKLYAQALGGRRVDTRPRTSEDVGNLRLGSLRGCNPLVWHPRSIDLAKGILSDFDFKTVVDCFSRRWCLGSCQFETSATQAVHGYDNVQLARGVFCARSQIQPSSLPWVLKAMRFATMRAYN